MSSLNEVCWSVFIRISFINFFVCLLLYPFLNWSQWAMISGSARAIYSTEQYSMQCGFIRLHTHLCVKFMKLFVCTTISYRSSQYDSYTVAYRTTTTTTVLLQHTFLVLQNHTSFLHFQSESVSKGEIKFCVFFQQQGTQMDTTHIQGEKVCFLNNVVNYKPFLSLSK